MQKMLRQTVDEKRALEMENLRLKMELENLKSRNSSLLGAAANQDAKDNSRPEQPALPGSTWGSRLAVTSREQQDSPLSPLQTRGSPVQGRRDQFGWGDASSPSVGSTSAPRERLTLPTLSGRPTDQRAADAERPSPWAQLSSGYPGSSTPPPLPIAGAVDGPTFGSPDTKKSLELPKSPRFQSSVLAGLSSPDSGLPKSPRFQSSVLSGGSPPANFGVGNSSPGGDLFKVQQDAAQEHQALVTDLRALEQWAKDLRARSSG